MNSGNRTLRAEPSVGAAALGALAIVVTVAWAALGFAGPAQAQCTMYCPNGAGLGIASEGLRVTNVKSRRTASNGVSVLIVEGKVTNTSSGPLGVPHMQGWLRDSKDQALQTWEFYANTAWLAAGESTSFKTEVEEPSRAATGLSINFMAGAPSGRATRAAESMNFSLPPAHNGRGAGSY
jgi:hypothetical protein